LGSLNLMNPGCVQEGSGIVCGKHPKRRKWLPHEDDELCRQVKLLGKNWPAVAVHMDNRDASGCRKRYVNYLEPCLYKGEWTAEEDAALFNAYAIHGKHWSQIAREGILTRRSARALGWRWAKIFSRKEEAQARRSHPYKRPNPAAAAAAAAATATVTVAIPAVQKRNVTISAPEPSSVNCAQPISPPRAFVHTAAAAASAPMPLAHAPVQSQTEIAVFVRQHLEVLEFLRQLSHVLAISSQEPEQQAQAPYPVHYSPHEGWLEEPPPPSVLPHVTWELDDSTVDYAGWRDGSDL